MKGKDFYLQLPRLRIACRSWGSPKKALPILALHGWLDNVASFDPLAKVLVKLEPRFYIVAVDLPGHGYSEHLNTNYGFIFLDYIASVSEILEALQWKKCVLLGHSMGAAVAFLFSAVMPESVLCSVFLDGLGPFSLQDKKAPKQYLHFLEEYKRQRNAKAKSYRTMASLVRAKSIANKMSQSSAKLIIERNLKKTPQGYIWRYDKNLHLPSPLQLTEKHVHAFMARLKGANLLLLSESHKKGYPEYFKRIPKRIRRFKNIKVFRIKTGCHHFHMETAEETAQLIAEWLTKQPHLYSHSAATKAR